MPLRNAVGCCTNIHSSRHCSGHEVLSIIGELDRHEHLLNTSSCLMTLLSIWITSNKVVHKQVDHKQQSGSQTRLLDSQIEHMHTVVIWRHMHVGKQVGKQAGEQVGKHTM